ncbi:DinB family protein [Siphonobacter sp. SORGH_AS_0500]|uniref:DinB family protein n=1 Tax=Siphonobacter sp. SORGH_AS_0500 TaxID=1864824 RepID=UPI00286784DB|nr:DinB family protein [Siphonobacter sp. SORGH_AS_0500]MDR6195460.1 putative damage-inducible protein DinB [Siphonobacter sp. SORGH_AS_0500]
MAEKREVWLRGPLPDMPVLLQPVAHALLQAREELAELTQDFPSVRLWERPSELASPGFHLQHLTGVLDRLYTYARGEALTETQLEYLRAEGLATDVRTEELVQRFNTQVEKALEQLRQTHPDQLTQVRGVGRAQLPSTVLGLYVHSAEHTMRHVGQLLVTIRVLS